MSETLNLTVAGMNFELAAPDATWLADLAQRYAEFVTDRPHDWRVAVTHHPAQVTPPTPWVVHEGHVTRFHIGPIAGFIDLAGRVAEVLVMQPNHAGSAVDRTLSFILMQELPRSHDALLLHGAAIVRRGHGLAHSGRSGVGKTTTARLAAGHADVLVDENLVISLAGPQPLLLSTPFWGGSTPSEMIRRVNRQAPLRALLFPEHGPEFTLEPLSPSDAVLALLTTEKIAAERVSSATAWLATVERLVAQVPTYRLYFRPTAELWPFLDEALHL